MPDDIAIVIFVFFQKLRRAGKSYLVQVFFHFFFGHPDAFIANGQRFVLLVEYDLYHQVIHLPHFFAPARQRFKFRCGVNGIRDQFAQKNFLIGVQVLLDDGKNIFRLYGYGSFSHSCIV